MNVRKHSQAARATCAALLLLFSVCGSTASAQSRRASRSVETRIEIPPRAPLDPSAAERVQADEAATPVRLSLVLAMDSSFSLRTQVDRLINFGKAVVRESRAVGREACIYSFTSTDNMALLQGWTTSAPRLFEALDEIYVRAGETALIDAAYTAVEEAATRVGANTDGIHGAVVIVTDGEDKGSRRRMEELQKLIDDTRLGGTEILIFPVILSGKRNKTHALLTQIAERSGGAAFFVDRTDDPTKAASELVARLRGEMQNSASEK